MGMVCVSKPLGTLTFPLSGMWVITLQVCLHLHEYKVAPLTIQGRAVVATHVLGVGGLLTMFAQPCLLCSEGAYVIMGCVPPSLPA